MSTFAVTLKHACNWDTQRLIREQDRWAEHAAFMDDLVEDGFIVVGGPLGTGERTLHLVDASDEQAVKSRLRSDPWAQMGLLELDSITTWTLWLDDRLSPPSPHNPGHRPTSMTSAKRSTRVGAAIVATPRMKAHLHDYA